MPVPGIGDIAARAAGSRPYVVTYHAGSMHKGKRLPDILVWLYENGPLKWLLGRATRIISASDAIRTGFLEKYLHKTETVTPGIDSAAFAPNPNLFTTSPTLLFVAGLNRAEEYKGLTTLLDALRILQDTFNNIRLDIVGEGDMRAEYEQQTKRLNLDGVTFKGRLAGK